METTETRIKGGYGELLAQVKNKEFVDYVEFGSYQGEWVAVLKDGDNFELWKGYYGSCSGCDSLESEKNYEHDDVPLSWAQEYFKEDRPFVVIPKETLERMTEETFMEVIPANVRNDIYEFDGKELYETVMKHIT